MLKKTPLTIALFFVSGFLMAQDVSFPTSYEGLWEGELKIYKPTNSKEPAMIFMRPKVIMQLDISKNDTAHCWNFIIRYVAQGNLDERKHLLKKDSFSESYIIEEQNTVKLYSYLRGNVLLEHFSLPETDVTCIYKFNTDSIFTQMISSEVAPVTWTGGSKGIPKIFSYLVNGYQDAILVRKKR